MHKKLKVTLKVFDNVACKYPDTKIYIEEVIYFAFEFFEQIDGLFFHALAIFIRQIRYLDTYD